MQNKEFVERIWNKYDLNRDNILDPNELEQFLDDICCPGSGLETQKAALRSLIDTNGDGYVEKREMLNALNINQFLCPNNVQYFKNILLQLSNKIATVSNKINQSF